MTCGIRHTAASSQHPASDGHPTYDTRHTYMDRRESGRASGSSYCALHTGCGEGSGARNWLALHGGLCAPRIGGQPSPKQSIAWPRRANSHPSHQSPVTRHRLRLTPHKLTNSPSSPWMAASPPIKQNGPRYSNTRVAFRVTC